MGAKGKRVMAKQAIQSNIKEQNAGGESTLV